MIQKKSPRKIYRNLITKHRYIDNPKAYRRFCNFYFKKKINRIFMDDTN